jgi:hypothetical protein
MAFYVRIVTTSLSDIQYFFFMLCLIIATFSNALVILDKRKYEENEDQSENYKSFLTDVSGEDLTNSFI